MHSDGKKPLDLGKRDPAILAMFGSIGPMMALVTSSSFKLDFFFSSRVYETSQFCIFNDSTSSMLNVKRTFLQLAEDIGAAPIWVFNNGILRQAACNRLTLLYSRSINLILYLCAGISHNDEVETASIMPFVQV